MGPQHPHLRGDGKRLLDDLGVAVEQQHQVMRRRQPHQLREHRLLRILREQVQLADAGPDAVLQLRGHPRRQRGVVHPVPLVEVRSVHPEQRNHPFGRVPIQLLRQLRRRAADRQPAHRRRHRAGPDISAGVNTAASAAE
jgi:hypothetical protein